MGNTFASNPCCTKTVENIETSRAGRKSRWGLAGAVLGAFGASVCCILPVAVGVLGFGSAALGVAIAPLRPYLLAWTALLLTFGFYRAYRPQNLDCAKGQSCTVPENRRHQRIALWVTASVALALATFPYYRYWIF